MNESQKIQYLIVDTSAFIRNASLQVKYFLKYKINLIYYLYYIILILYNFIILYNISNNSNNKYQFQNIGVNIITEQDVVNEVINKRQLRRLVVLPYDLKIKNAYSENIKFGKYNFI